MTAIGAGCNAGSLLWEDPVAPSTLELSCPVWIPGVPQAVHPSCPEAPLKACEMLRPAPGEEEGELPPAQGSEGPLSWEGVQSP